MDIGFSKKEYGFVQDCGVLGTEFTNYVLIDAKFNSSKRIIIVADLFERDSFKKNAKRSK